MSVPRRLRIGPHLWRVRRREIAGGDYGSTDERRLRITIAPWVQGSQLADTLLHELLHAIWSQCALIDLDGDAQERVVRSFTPWLLAVLRDNPRLVTVLTAGDTPANSPG